MHRTIARETAALSHLYNALGTTFSAPQFESDRRFETRETDRFLVGPKLVKGIVRCKDCRSYNTMAYPYQKAAADEETGWDVKCLNPRCTGGR